MKKTKFKNEYWFIVTARKNSKSIKEKYYESLWERAYRLLL